MFKQRVQVHFQDGTETEVVLTQWSISQWAVYSSNKGYKQNMQDPGMMAVTMLRYQAYATMHRDPKATRPSFELWDLTVDEVAPIQEPEEVDPTQQTLSAVS